MAFQNTSWAGYKFVVTHDWILHRFPFLENVDKFYQNLNQKITHKIMAADIILTQLATIIALPFLFPLITSTEHDLPNGLTPIGTWSELFSSLLFRQITNCVQIRFDQ